MGFTIEQLSARESIRDLAARYCYGVDRLDPDVMKSAYWPDAVDEHGTYVGNAWEFVDHCMVSHRRWRSTMHCIFNHLIELDDDGISGTGQVYNVTYLLTGSADGGPDERTDVWFGRYLDRYEQRDGEWRIAHRVCVHEGTRSDVVVAPMAIPAELFRQGSFDRPAAGRRIGP